MNETDRIPVKSLTSRYKIGRTALYERFKQIKVEPIKDGTRSYISGLSLSRLDKLDDHLNTGGSFGGFRVMEEIDPPTLKKISQDLVTQSPQLDLPGVVYKLIEVIAQKKSDSYLDKYRELEEIVSCGWIIPTSAVHEIIGVMPRKEVFFYGCFSFTRDRRVGRETGWKVSKDS